MKNTAVILWISLIAAAIIILSSCSQLPANQNCWPVEVIMPSNSVGMKINPDGSMTPTVTHNHKTIKYQCSNGMFYWITE
jgi:hypothetical protein